MGPVLSLCWRVCVCVFCLCKSHLLHQTSNAPSNAPRSTSLDWWLLNPVFSSPLNWVLPREGGYVSPSVWELPEDKGSVWGCLACCSLTSCALGVFCGGLRGCRKSLLACLGDGRVEHGYSRYGFSCARAVGGMAREQVLSSPGPKGSQA